MKKLFSIVLVLVLALACSAPEEEGAARKEPRQGRNCVHGHPWAAGAGAASSQGRQDAVLVRNPSRVHRGTLRGPCLPCIEG